MCIICVKPAGVKIPEFKYFQNAAIQNDDGFGIMYPVNNKVFGQKFFSDVKDVYDELQRIGKDKPIVTHFRFATHGSKSIDAAHPFPVSNLVSDLNAWVWESDLGVCHNGIVSGFGEKLGNIGLSDTQDFIKKIVSIPEISLNISKRSVRKAIRKLAGGKWAFLDKHGKITMVGEFVQRFGCFWSNNGFQSFYRYYGDYGDWYGYKEPKDYVYVKRGDGVWERVTTTPPKDKPATKDNFCLSCMDDAMRYGFTVDCQECSYNDAFGVKDSVKTMPLNCGTCDSENCYQCEHFTFD